MSFDRTGKCPICYKPFQSKECTHSWDYVHRVLQTANNNFAQDVNKVKNRKKKRNNGLGT